MRRSLFVPSVLVPCVLGAIGCGPSMHELVRGRHWREAVCAAHQGSNADRSEAASGLTRDAGTLVHVHALTPEELRPALGDDVESFTQRAWLVRVMAQTNVMPLDGLRLEAALTNDAKAVIGPPADWEALAWATNERLPPKRRESTYLTGQNIVKGLGAILTAGLTLPFTEFYPGTVEVDAPLTEYLRVAPRASALHWTASRWSCSGGSSSAQGASQRCTGFFVLDAHRRDEVRLSLRLHAKSKKEPTSPTASEEERYCKLEATATVPIGNARALGEMSSRLFGDRMRPIAEFHAD